MCVCVGGWSSMPVWSRPPPRYCDAIFCAPGPAVHPRRGPVPCCLSGVWLGWCLSSPGHASVASPPTAFGRGRGGCMPKIGTRLTCRRRPGWSCIRHAHLCHGEAGSRCGRVGRRVTEDGLQVGNKDGRRAGELELNGWARPAGPPLGRCNAPPPCNTRCNAQARRHAALQKAGENRKTQPETSSHADAAHTPRGHSCWSAERPPSPRQQSRTRHAGVQDPWRMGSIAGPSPS